MTLNQVSTWITVVGIPAIGAGGGCGAWRATVRANRRERERDLASERERLRPLFTVTSIQANSGVENADLRLHLDGPDDLPRLDEVRIEIRDDRHDRADDWRPGGSVTREELANQVWGPWRFKAGCGGVDAYGRTVEPVQNLPRGEAWLWSLSRTTEPHWTTPDYWRREYDGKLLRLRITSRYGEYTWEDVREVSVQPHERFVFPTVYTEPPMRVKSTHPGQ